MSGFRIEDGSKEASVSKITADRRLWLTADGELVEDGDPRGAFLWAGEGREVPADEAKRLGYKPSSKAKDDPASTSTADAGDDESFVCDVCGKEAKSAAGLAAHKRSHDED